MKVLSSPAWISQSTGAWRRSDPGAVPWLAIQPRQVLVVGFANGKVKATNKTFEDNWVFAMTVRDGKVTDIREYVDKQALARAP